MYEDFEKLLEPLNAKKEVRVFADHVGAGKGLRQRLKESGFKDYRFDYQVQDILIEIQGYGFSHQGKGQQRDWQKNNDAVKLGYRVLYFPADMAKKTPHVIIDEIRECLETDSQ